MLTDWIIIFLVMFIMCTLGIFFSAIILYTILLVKKIIEKIKGILCKKFFYKEFEKNKTIRYS